MRPRILVAGLVLAGLAIFLARAAPTAPHSPSHKGVPASLPSQHRDYSDSKGAPITRQKPATGAGEIQIEQAGAPRRWQQISAVVHVHSAASTGEYSLTTLSEMARGAGVDVLVLAENLVLDIRYAPWPVRYFGELHRTMPSLRERGVVNFLAEIEEVQSRQPETLLLPGVEVMPHYYWTGSLARNNKTLHNTQRNMLVVLPPPTEGLQAADAVDRSAAFLEGLPAIGNHGGEQLGWWSLAELLPGVLLLGYGIRRVLKPRPPPLVTWRGTMGMATRGGHRVPMKEVVIRVLLLASGIFMLVHNYPYSSPVYSPYDDEAGIAPYQGLIDYTREEGGLVYWSMPEAADRQEVDVGPLNVRLSTEPYAEALEQTVGYTGFGGLYAGNISLTDTGGLWDRILLSYCRGERGRPPWIIGESAFHYTGQAGKRLSDILTVLWVEESGREDAFEALAKGRSYAMQRSQPDALRLQEFTLGVQSNGQVAWPGETLDLSGEIQGDIEAELEIELVIEMSTETGAAVPVQVQIIRQGEISMTWEETTPFRRHITEVIEPGEEIIYYRLIAHGPRPLQVVSNPIFVRRQ